MKKLLFSLFLIIILLTVFVIYQPISKTPEIIGIIPLDSRPCNTQYPELLGEMANSIVEIPYQYLDNYLTPADRAMLWNWLDTNAKDFDKIIINTTELLQGGLIASRHPQSYETIERQLERLQAFCLENKNKEIIIITVLPRLLPSQFSQLWPYKDELTNYAKSIDKNSLNGKKLPTPPKSIPADILSQYLSIYENSQHIAQTIITLTKQGLVNHYLIGQDDAEKYGLSNKIVRDLEPQFNNKIRFVHGADELTLLALAQTTVPRPEVNIKLVYTNESLKDDFFPFEAGVLEKVISTKMAYLNLEKNLQAPYREIIHTDSAKVGILNDQITNKSQDYLGIMDIAYTNKGDIALIDHFLAEDVLKLIDGYAGWNTASNTIGTELAHFIFYQNLKKNFKSYNKNRQKSALEAYIKFKFIRIAEDLVYQGILREELNQELLQKDINPYHLEENKEVAEEILRKLYQPYQEKLARAFVGEYNIGNIKFIVENVSATIHLPWGRTFEAKIKPQVKISED